MRILKSVLASTIMVAGLTGIVSAKEVKPLADPDDIYGNYKWTWPTSGSGSHVITGKYGELREGERNRYHVGIDIGVYEKPVYAVADGEVVKSGQFNDGAQVIIIEHDDTATNGNQIYTRYLHLKAKSRLVKTNDRVSEGEKIATSGNTGGVKHHLHFDINDDEDESPEFNDNVEDTINPYYFYPHDLDRFAFVASEQHADHVHGNYDNPDNYFDQLLIDYVGEERFHEWFESLEQSERTVTNLKRYFNLSDEDVENVFRK